MQIFMTVKAARPRLKCGMRCIRCGGNSSIIFGIAGNAATRGIELLFGGSQSLMGRAKKSILDLASDQNEHSK
jgi:hypothetical protein